MGPALRAAGDQPAVLHVIGQYGLAGAEKQLARLAARQARRGRRVEVCVLGGELAPALVELTRPARAAHLPGKPRGLRRLRALARKVRSEGWELLAGQLFSGNLYAVAAGRWTDTPATTFEGGLEPWSRGYHWSVCRWYWRRAALVEVNALAVRSNVISHGGPADKLRLIYNGVEPQPPVTVEEQRRARNELGLGAEPVVCMVANLHRPKDPETLLEAVAGLETARGPATLLLAGDGPLRRILEDRVRRRGLSDRVRLLGRISDVRSVLAAADVSCLSSRAEGLSNSIIEALAAGVPCAASRAGGNAELLGDDERGLLFEVGDVAGCRWVLRRLLTEPVLAQKLAAAGRDWVVEELSFERNLALHDNLYAEARRRWSRR